MADEMKRGGGWRRKRYMVAVATMGGMKEVERSRHIISQIRKFAWDEINYTT